MLKGSDVRGNLNQQREMDMNYSIKRYAKICKFTFNRIFPGVCMHIVPGGVDVYGGTRTCNLHSMHVLNSKKPIRLDAAVRRPCALRNKHVICKLGLEVKKTCCR